LQNSRCNIHTLYGFFAILLWSTSVALTRSVAEQIGTFSAGYLVCLTSGITGLTFFYCSGGSYAGIKALSKKYLFSGGMCFVFYILVFFLAVQLAANRYQVLQVGLLNYLWPFFTILFSLYFLNKKAHLMLMPATLLSILGIFLIISQGLSITWQGFTASIGSNPLAYGLALIGAVSWALYSNLASRLAGQDGGVAVSIFFLIAGIIFLLVRVLRTEQSNWNIRVAMEILVMSLIVSLSYNCWDSAMRKGNIILLAACSYFIPVLSTLVSCIYLKVAAGLSLWIGCVLIATGAFVSWISISEKKVL
jgi:drug/metabolite transporter (DMT)-like permease